MKQLFNSLDPRTRVAFLVTLYVLVFIDTNILYQIIFSLFFLMFMVLFKQSLTVILKPVRFLIFFLPLTFIIHLFFTTRGVQFFSLHNLSELWNILETPFKFTLRVWNIIVITGFGLRFLKRGELLEGITLLLQKPRKRFRFLEDFSQILNIALRFFPIIKEEYDQVSLAERMFQIKPPSSLKERIKRLSWVLPSVFALSLRRAENLAIAMELRGYGLHFPRSDYITSELNSKDWLIIHSCLIIIVINVVRKFLL